MQLKSKVLKVLSLINYRIEKSVFAEICFTSDIGLVNYNIWLTLCVSKHPFIYAPWHT
jgi:hypothetical protein